MLDKDSIKKSISIGQIEYLLELYGGEPTLMKPGVLVSRTIDHNDAHEGSRKLYYYDNEDGGLFRSYTGDELGAFDIFDLIIKIYDIQFNKQLDLPGAARIICGQLGITLDGFNEETDGFVIDLPDLKLVERNSKLNEIDVSDKKLEFKVYDDNTLNHLPQIRIGVWEDEGINFETIKMANIRYNPKNCAIVIPYYNDDNKLIGIRERLLAEDMIETYGKYHPSYLGGVMYNHPTGLSVYGLNFTKENIKKYKKVIIFESEKSVLKYNSFFGSENNIAVAVCGSMLSKQQVQLIMKYQPEEIIIAFDRDFEEKNDATFLKQIKRLKNIHKEYSPLANITFIWDSTGEKLSPHESPIDRGKETFIELFNNRVKI